MLLYTEYINFISKYKFILKKVLPFSVEFITAVKFATKIIVTVSKKWVIKQIYKCHT